MIHITEDQLLTMLNSAWWNGHGTSRYTPNLHGSATSCARGLLRDFKETPAYADPDFDEPPKPVQVQAPAPLTDCAAARDGECHHKLCPQIRDREPETSGRHCPLDQGKDDY